MEIGNLCFDLESMVKRGVRIVEWGSMNIGKDRYLPIHMHSELIGGVVVPLTV